MGASKSFFISISIIIFIMKFLAFQFLSVAMLVLCAFAVPLSEELSPKLIKRKGGQEEKREGFRGWLVAPVKQEKCEYKDDMMCCHNDDGTSVCGMVRSRKRVFSRNSRHHYGHCPPGMSPPHCYRMLNQEQEMF